MVNFIDFGIKKPKKIYETLSGDLYDTYFLARYFNDIYNLDRVIKKNSKAATPPLIHDTKDLKFNLINFLLLSRSKKKKFYEFGFTLFEKIFYFKFFNNFFSKKLNLEKIKFCGTDISDRFIFFCKNFYKDYTVRVSKNIKKDLFLNSVFYSKGVTLLYEKKNMSCLHNFIKYSESGSFDISFYPQKKVLTLETGYKLYYPSVNEFINLIKNSNKCFFYRNKKRVGKRLYLEILFGEKYLDKIINNKLLNLSKKKLDKNLKKKLFLSIKFKELKCAYLK